jgi:membrane protease YdiL (CAAX protease family)
MTPDETNPPSPGPSQPPESPERLSQPAEAPAVVHGSTSEQAPPLNQDPFSSAPSLPEDIRVPWDWIDLAIFALLALGGTFAVSIGLIFVFSAFHVTPAQLRASPSLRTYFAVLNQVVLSFVLIGFMAAQVRTRSRAPFWRTIGWRPLETGRVPKAAAYVGLIASGFLLSLLVQLASTISRPKTKLPIEVFFQDRRSALVLMAVSVAFAPFLEETIFRGYIYPGLARSWGIAASVIVTGTLFGLMHAPQLWGGWLQIALLVLVGIVFTSARAATRTVVTSYLLHLSYNSFLFLTFLIGSHWLRPIHPVH